MCTSCENADPVSTPWNSTRIRTALVLFFCTVAVYATVAGTRIWKSSANNHFAYLARSHLSGTTRMIDMRPHGNDWARVVTLTLADGRIVRGTWWKSQGSHVFRTLSGGFLQIPDSQIRTRTENWYVTFPPMPAWMMLPGVAIWGLSFNDVLFTLLLSTFNTLLFWFLLLQARTLQLHTRTDSQILILTALFAFGTVNFFSSVRGEVWYTAHIAGITWLLAYFLALLKRRAFWAGFFLGGAFLCRTPLLFAVFLYPAWVAFQENSWRVRQHHVREALAYAAPIIVFMGVAMFLNYVRFENPFEFGHRYLEIAWRNRIERYGMFSYEYLSRNLSAMLTLLPRFLPHAPFVQISPHGMALWLTTPVFLLLVRAQFPHAFTRCVWLFGVLPVSLPTLLYQNSGFVQFGYRFSLDFTVPLLLLLAMSNVRFSRLFYVLVGISILVNLFGAITFGRFSMFYPSSNFFFFVM